MKTVFKLELFSNKNTYGNKHTKEHTIYIFRKQKVINFKITKGEKIGMESLKKKSIICFILGLAMFLSFASLGIFTSKVYAATTIDRIDIASETTSVQAGVLPNFTASTTTEHASIKESDSNNFWVRWPAGASTWEGFLSDTKAAFNDGSTRYGLRLRVYLEDGYQFSDNTQIYFNGVKKEEYTNMVKSLRNGNYDYFFYIDLGLATTGTNPITHTVTFDTDGGTPPIESRTIVDGYKTSKPSDPTKKGYIFKGWYTDNTYKTEFNFSNAIKADTTIYAKWEALVINEIRISSTTISVEAGALPSFDATTATEHATIEDYGANTCWLKWKDGAINWSGFGDDYKMAVNDGKTHYGLRIKVNISDDYQFSDSTKVYFNDEDVTTKGHTEIKKYSWGGYVIIDLGLATGDFVTATSYEELKAAVDGCDGSNVTDSATNHVKLGADIAIPASSSMLIAVINDFTLDLNGHTLAITNDNSNMVIMYGSNGINDFTSGSLTITDTSASQKGTINLGIKPIFVYQNNTSNTGMHYKLTIDGGKFYGISGVSNHFFEFNTDNEYYWKDKLITFDFKITKGYFEHVSTNMSSIILANDMKLNNVTFNMSFDNLTFKAGSARLMTSNETYTMNDVVPEDTDFYIFNSSGDKQILITERTTSATLEVPSNLWYHVGDYTDPNYYGIKLVKKDGFDVTAPTFDDVNYGYSSVSAKGISIYNRGTSDLQVKSVIVDDTSKFTVTGSTEPTIPSKATDDTSFTIQPVDDLDAGTHTATITVTDMADKTYTATVSFTVEPKDITLTLVISAISDQTYKGENIEPTIEVKDGTTLLALTTDYTVSYENNLNRGTATVKITKVEGSNYTWTGEMSQTFIINPKTITPTIEDIADQDYTGSAIEPPIVVKDGATKLTLNTDYTVGYNNNTNKGTTAKVIVTSVGTSNYTWTTPVEKTFNIVAYAIKEDEVALGSTTEEYTGNPIKPTVTVTVNGTSLTVDTDYEVSYTTNTNVGTATVTVTGIGNYGGTVSKEFEITPKKLTKPTLSGSYTYNGTLQTATLSAEYDSLTMTASNNTRTDAGSQKIKVELKDKTNYAWDDGSATDLEIDFVINPKSMTPTIEEIATQTYTGNLIEPTIVVKDGTTPLDKNTDYEVTFVNNQNAGTATVKVTAKAGSNYTWDGEVTKDFTINPMTITPTIADIADVTFNNEEQTPEITVTVDSKTLEKDTDYTVIYENNIYVGTAKVKVTAKEGRNYTWTGEITKNFKINTATSVISGSPANVTDSTNTSAVVLIGKTLDISTFVTLNPSEYQSDLTFTITDVGSTGASLDTDGKTLKGITAEGIVTIKASFAGKELDGDSDLEYSPATDLTIYVKVVDKEEVTIGGLTYADKVYDGAVVTPTGTLEVSDNKVSTNELIVKYEKFDSSWTEITELSANVGKYRVTYSVSDTNENYTGSKSYEFEITVKKLTKPTLEGTYTYTGEEQTAVLVNVDNETMNVTNNTRTEVGNQNIEVTLKDTTNYAWDDDTTDALSIPFEIAKATPTITLSNLSQKEGSVTAVTYTVTPATTDGIVKVEYKVSTEEDSTYKETLPTTKGTYTVRVTVAGDSNLEDTQNTATLTITRKTSGGGGGSAATTKYTITVKQNSNGKISPETVKVEKGNDKTFEIKANAGYEIEDVKVDSESVGAVKEYTFENVKAAHTIEATFKKVEEVAPVEPEDGWKNPFVDVSEDDWYYEAVKFANENKLFNGVSENEFGANVKMTRGMLVTVLYRLAGEPATNKSIPFADVDTAMYYANPISWAKQNGIVNGVDENNFAPDAEISRQQLVTILYRFAKLMGKDVSVGEDTNILSYDDVNQVAEYAIPAMQWACGAGIITGRTESTLAPIGNATRAEVATMLMRFINN